MRFRRGDDSAVIKSNNANRNKIADLFCDLLPAVSDEIASAFVGGMCDYRSLYQVYVDGSDTYEELHQYRDEAVVVLNLSRHDLWVYAPQFKQVVARAISWLFDTRITHISESSSTENTFLVMLVDAALRRWAVTIRDAEDAICVSVRMPLSNTRVTQMKPVPIHVITRPGALVLLCLPLDLH